jgi:hypothetical protein
LGVFFRELTHGCRSNHSPQRKVDDRLGWDEALVDLEGEADDDGASDPETNAGGRQFGLANLHALARDLGTERLG